MWKETRGTGKQQAQSEQCAAAAKKTNMMLGCISTISDNKVIIPLYSAFLRLCSVFVPAIQRKDVDRLERVHIRTTRMIKGLGSLKYTERTGFVQP